MSFSFYHSGPWLEPTHGMTTYTMDDIDRGYLMMVNHFPSCLGIHEGNRGGKKDRSFIDQAEQQLLGIVSQPTVERFAHAYTCFTLAVASACLQGFSQETVSRLHHGRKVARAANDRIRKTWHMSFIGNATFWKHNACGSILWHL